MRFIRTLEGGVNPQSQAGLRFSCTHAVLYVDQGCSPENSPIPLFSWMLVRASAWITVGEPLSMHVSQHPALNGLAY